MNCTNCKATSGMLIQTEMSLRVRRLMELGGYDTTPPARATKLEEETAEFREAVDDGHYQLAAREAADVMVVAWSALLDLGYNPLGIMLEVIDRKILLLQTEEALKVGHR